jgi:DUF971 family protein
MVGPDPYAPRDVHLVGRYALGVDWQNNHSSIYPFDFLRAACPCPGCEEARAAGPSPSPEEPQSWPVEVRKEGTGLRIRWQDDHETVFGGHELRDLCRCATCTTRPA